MATLAPSLRNLFAELDQRWPNRDRRTDGWLRYWRPGEIFSDHNPDHLGRVHAIDIDVDGISPTFVVANVIARRAVVSYVIFNRRIYGHWNTFLPQVYTGTTNPHTDHIHVSIQRNDQARNYGGSWSIAGPSSGFGIAPPPLDAARRDLRFSQGLERMGRQMRARGHTIRGYTRSIAKLR